MASSVDVKRTQTIVQELTQNPAVAAILAQKTDPTVPAADHTDVVNTGAEADRAIDSALAALQEANPEISKDVLEAGIHKAEEALAAEAEQEKKKPHSTLRVMTKDFIRRTAVVATVLAVLMLPATHNSLKWVADGLGAGRPGASSGLLGLVYDCVLVWPFAILANTGKFFSSWRTAITAFVMTCIYNPEECQRMTPEEEYERFWSMPTDPLHLQAKTLCRTAVTYALCGMVGAKFLSVFRKNSSVWGREGSTTKAQEKSETRAGASYNPLVALTRPVDCVWGVPRGGPSAPASAPKPKLA
jgi:hypothetical protein